MSTQQVKEAFHRWYYDQRLWDKVEFLGVKTLKCVFDLWNYQEIISAIKPDMIVETGALFGGSTLFFSVVLSEINPRGRVVTIEINSKRIDRRVVERSNVIVIQGSSIEKEPIDELIERRTGLAGCAFVILDTKPRMEHVLAELVNFRRFLRTGDYLVVEDTNVNGHPVLVDWGPGPMEAVQEYFRRYPNEFTHDEERATKFGMTFAPSAYLRRC